MKVMVCAKSSTSYVWFVSTYVNNILEHGCVPLKDHFPCNFFLLQHSVDARNFVLRMSFCDRRLLLQQSCFILACLLLEKLKFFVSHICLRRRIAAWTQIISCWYMTTMDPLLPLFVCCWSSFDLSEGGSDGGR